MTTSTSRRAQPLSVEDRQEMIIDAVTPALIKHGRAVTSKQLAEAAGLAEGTIFRAFGDKESLIAAVVARNVDPEPFRDELRRIEPTLGLDDKVLALVALLHARFETVFHLMAALGEFSRPQAPDARHEFATIVERLLQPHAAQLAFPPSRIAQIIRSVTLAASLPQLNEGAPFDAHEVAALLVHGIGARRDTDATHGVGARRDTDATPNTELRQNGAAPEDTGAACTFDPDRK